MPQHPRTKLFILFLILVAAVFGYNYFARPFGDLRQRAEVPSPTPELSKAEIIIADAAFNSLSAKEKIAQMLTVPATASDSSPVDSSWIEKENPGFVLIFGSGIRKNLATETISTLQSLVQAQGKMIRPAVAVDHEGGEVQRLNGIGFTQLPSWQELCEAEAVDRGDLLKESSSELSDAGINIVFAPVLDVAENNNILRTRICSGDEEEVASRAAEFSEAFMKNKILPVYKHFPGIGSAGQDLHFSFAQVEVDDETSGLYRQLLSQFPYAGVMVTHAGVANSNSPNVPCSLSGECIGALHRYFPNSLTFTDSLTMESVYYSNSGGSRKTLAEVSRQAVLAGNDVLVYDQQVTSEDLSLVLNELEAAYHKDPFFAGRVDESVKKIIVYKEQLNLLMIE